jgi:hypothetical protein
MTADTEPAAASGDKDTIARLADRGEEVMRRLADFWGGQRALKAFNDLRERVDDLSRKMRGIDVLEARLTALERRVDALDGGPPPEPEPEPAESEELVEAETADVVDDGKK